MHKDVAAVQDALDGRRAEGDIRRRRSSVCREAATRSTLSSDGVACATESVGWDILTDVLDGCDEVIDEFCGPVADARLMPPPPAKPPRGSQAWCLGCREYVCRRVTRASRRNRPWDSLPVGTLICTQCNRVFSPKQAA